MAASNWAAWNGARMATLKIMHQTRSQNGKIKAGFLIVYENNWFLSPSQPSFFSQPVLPPVPHLSFLFFFSFGVHSKFCSLPSSCRMYLSSLLCISSKINTGLNNTQKPIHSFNFRSFSDAIIPNDLSSAGGKNSIYNTVRFHSQCLLSLLPSSYSSTWHLAHLMSIHLMSSYLTC